MFKNLIVYRIGPGWAANVAHIEDSLALTRFVPCGASQEKSLGWVEPRGQAHGPLIESVGGQLILQLHIETRSVPGSVLNRKTKERLAEIEATTGRKPGKKETRDIKEDLKLALLPQAFTKESSVKVWIDPQAGLLCLDTGSQARADDVVTLLVTSLAGLALTLLDTQTSPTAAMSQWLITQEAPAHFTVDRDCELKAADESKAVVRYARHPLDTDEVRGYVESGKLPTRLALTWQGRVSLLLTEGLQLKKLAFLDDVFQGTAVRGKGDDFDADVAIATGELSQLLPDLLAALGGEVIRAAVIS